MTQSNNAHKPDYNSDLSVFFTISKFIPDQQTLFNFTLANKLLYANSVSNLYKSPKITKLVNLVHFNEVLIGSKSLYSDFLPQLNLFVKELNLSLIEESIPCQLVNQLLYNVNLLKRINLSNCSINSRTLQLISNLHGDSLIELNLSNCATVDPDIWHQFRFNMKHLKALKLSNTAIGDSELLNLILLCKDSLEELDLDGCERLTEYSKRFITKLLPNIRYIKLPSKFSYDYRDPSPFFFYIEEQIIKDHKHHRLVSLYDYYSNQPEKITLFHHIQYNTKFFKNLLNLRGLNIAIIKELRLISLKLAQVKMANKLGSRLKKEDRDYPEFNLNGLRWNLPKELINNQSNTPGYILLSKILWAHWNPNYLPKVPLLPPSTDQSKTPSKAATRATKPVLGRYPVTGGLYNTQPPSSNAVMATAPPISPPRLHSPTNSFNPVASLQKPTPRPSPNYYNEIDDTIQSELESEEDESLSLPHSTWKLLPKSENPTELSYSNDSPINSDLDLSFD